MWNIKKMKTRVRSDKGSFDDSQDFLEPFVDAVEKRDKHKLLIGNPFEEYAYDFYWRYWSQNKKSHANFINLQIGFSLAVSDEDDLLARILIKTTEYHPYSIPEVDYLFRRIITLESEDNVVEVAEDIIEIADTYYLMDELLKKLHPSLRKKPIELLPM
jgi:hypothetical protein